MHCAGGFTGMKGINIPDLIMPDEQIQKHAYKIFDSLLDVRDYLLMAYI
jgi:hypothetical protein